MLWVTSNDSSNKTEMWVRKYAVNSHLPQITRNLCPAVSKSTERLSRSATVSPSQHVYKWHIPIWNTSLFQSPTKYCSNIGWIYTHSNATAKIRTQRLLVDYTSLWLFSRHYSRSWGQRERERKTSHVTLFYSCKIELLVMIWKNTEQTTCCIRYHLFNYLLFIILAPCTAWKEFVQLKALEHCTPLSLSSCGARKSDRPGCIWIKCFSLFER